MTTMLAILTKTLLVFALATSALAQSSYMTGLLDTFRNNSLTTLVELFSTFNASTLSAFESSLSTGNHTVFAPNNDAFAQIPDLASTNATQLLQEFSYHILSGAVNTNDTSNDKVTIARTNLTGAPTVNLPGNQPQAIVLSKTTDNRLTVVNAASGQNITTIQSIKYQNLLIEVIPTALTIPGNASTTIAGISDLSTLVSTSTSVDPNLPQILDQTKGITILAPINSAFTDNAQLGSVAPADVNKILLNHIINGTVAYSPQITNGMQVTSAGGATLTFASNSSGIFITAANSTARVVTSNILVSNGVVHTIDKVLFDTTYNPAAASSAASSATSVQGAQTSVQSGPITAPATATPGGAAYNFKIDGIVITIAVVGLGALLA